ncbi:hypothetical protein CDAR_475881 [Caerostris darwini]|uniref:Uncharacterized protein n=1 Tax=Caerostris darwini TaxID=1538125 RepID=A0AAV4P8Q4_9ARAC|nr:hypothetical protein CDAR_475881 [Caerostris darwini]
MLSIVLISRNCGLIKVLNLESSSHFHRNGPFIRGWANNGGTPQLYSWGACCGRPVPRFLPNPAPFSEEPPRYCPAILPTGTARMGLYVPTSG